MAATPKAKPRLKNLDELFNLNDGVNPLELQEAAIDDTKRDKIVEIPLTELYSFENHPFRVLDDETMDELVRSISVNGVMHPGIARPRKDGGYELIAGHRRKRACEIIGIETMKVIVREIDDDTAVIIMADSNLLYRDTLLFSEKAFAYKMKADAVKRQAGRPSKENGSQIGINKGKKSYELLGEQSGESKNQVYRYIRLTDLLPEILAMVDNKSIGFCPGYELSYLTKEEQKLLIYEMEKEEVTPSLSQAQRMKKLSQEGKLDEEAIGLIMREEKKDVIKVTLTHKRLKEYFPDSFTPQQMEQTIIKLLEGWCKRNSTQQK